MTLSLKQIIMELLKKKYMNRRRNGITFHPFHQKPRKLSSYLVASTLNDAVFEGVYAKQNVPFEKILPPTKEHKSGVSPVQYEKGNLVPVNLIELLSKKIFYCFVSQKTYKTMAVFSASVLRSLNYTKNTPVTYTPT